MADKENAAPANNSGVSEKPSLTRPARQDVETQVGETTSLSLDLGVAGLEQGNNQHKVQGTEDGVEVEVGMGDQNTVRHEDANLNPDGTKKVEGQEEQQQQEAPDAPLPVDKLPEFDAAKPEVVTQYSERYLGKDGQPDLMKVSADWAPKLDAAGEVIGGDLPEKTYKFLESKGYDKATIKGIEAGQIAVMKLDQAETFGLAGGPDTYRQAQAWAKEHWSDEQKKAFNEDRNAGGVRRANAVKLMVGDFQKAVPPDRRVSPAKTVVGNAGGGSHEASKVTGYATKAEWQADVRKAQRSNDQKLLNESRAKLKASAWYQDGNG